METINIILLAVAFTLGYFVGAYAFKMKYRYEKKSYSNMSALDIYTEHEKLSRIIDKLEDNGSN